MTTTQRASLGEGEVRAETLGSVVMVDEEEYDYEGARRAHGWC